MLYGEERPGDGIEQKQDMTIGRRLHETARIVLTRPPAITAASSTPASGTRSKSWSRPSSMNPRTESTEKTGARLCEFWGGGDL